MDRDTIEAFKRMEKHIEDHTDRNRMLIIANNWLVGLAMFGLGLGWPYITKMIGV